MCLIFLNFSLFFPISMSHFIVVHPLTLPFIGLTLGLLFTTVFSVYAGFWPKVMYIRGFLAKSRVYMQPFFKQSCTSSLLVNLMLSEVVGWVVSVVGSSWVLMLSIGCFFCDQRPLFH